MDTKIKWGVRVYEAGKKPEFMARMFDNENFYSVDWTYDLNSAFRIREQWEPKYPECEYVVEEYGQ